MRSIYTDRWKGWQIGLLDRRAGQYTGRAVRTGQQDGIYVLQSLPKCAVSHTTRKWLLYLCPVVHIGMVDVHQLSHKRNMTTTDSKVHRIQAVL